MSTFTVIAIMAGIGTLVTFFCGVKAMSRYGEFAHQRGTIWIKWHFLFEVTTFATILAAPLARMH